jgi:hypothetical protein
MTDEAPRLEFIASLPPIQSAIMLDGNGDGARVKMDIPASDVGAVLLLQHHFSGKTFKVTVEVDGSRSAGKSRQINY